MEEKPSTTKTQRIAIWVIAGLMIFGSVGFYFIIILQNQTRQERLAELREKIRGERNSLPLADYQTGKFQAKSVQKLRVTTLKEGNGETVKAGDTVSVYYKGWLPNGDVFDSNVQRVPATPATFSLDSVIEGWTQGLSGMKVNGVRKLVIPAKLAYGKQGRPKGGIPPNTPLAFIVKVVDIKDKQQQKKADAVGGRSRKTASGRVEN